MKKTTIGFLALGTVIGSRPLAKRMRHKMQEHCSEMAAHCKQMTGQFRGHGEPAAKA